MDSSAHSADGREPWHQRLAPVAAAVVLVAGIGFLILRSSSGEESAPTTSEVASIATVQEPDEPLVETTVPNAQTALPPPTAPPLAETSVPPTTDPPTTDGAPPTGPSQIEVDASLLRYGRIVTVVSLATTIDVDDLNQDAFFAAGAVANTRAAGLVGSS